MKRMGIASKIICLVKAEMQESGTKEYVAYAKVANTKLYKLLKDPGTRLFLEPFEYVREAYNIETKDSVEKMLDFISCA